MRNRWLIATAGSLAIAASGIACKHHHHHDKSKTKEDQQITQGAAGPMSFAALPAAVKGSFDRQYPDAKVTRVEKEIEADGAVHYEIFFSTSNGTDDKAEFNADGSRAHD